MVTDKGRPSGNAYMLQVRIKQGCKESYKEQWLLAKAKTNLLKLLFPQICSSRDSDIPGQNHWTKEADETEQEFHWGVRGLNKKSFKSPCNSFRKKCQKQ